MTLRSTRSVRNVTDEVDQANRTIRPDGFNPRLVTFFQGATVFLVTFVVLWWALSRIDQ